VLPDEGNVSSYFRLFRSFNRCKKSRVLDLTKQKSSAIMPANRLSLETSSTASMKAMARVEQLPGISITTLEISLLDD